MKKYLWAIATVLFLVIVMLVILYFFRQVTSVAPKARGPVVGNSVSLDNSYVFASPVRASVNGDLIRITVFILDTEGRGVFDKKVTLQNSETTLDISEIQALTDETGKAIFDISASVTGIYLLESVVDNQILPQRVKIVFD